MADSFAARSTLRVGGEEHEIFRLDALQGRFDVAAAAVHAPDPARERAPAREERRATSRPSRPGMRRPSRAREIAFTPARVLLQDFTGVPAIVDLAAMRDAMRDLGGDPAKINPLLPAELVIDHSVQVDEFATRARDHAQRRARVRAEPRALRVPALGPDGASTTSRSCRRTPASATRSTSSTSRRVVESRDGRAFPDTLVGTDSHTTMINGLGVLGWGVGGIEAEAAMLGEADLDARAAGRRLPPQGRAARGRDRDRPRAHGHGDPSRRPASSGSSSSTSATASRRFRSPTARRSGTCRPSTARRAASSRSTSRRSRTCSLTARQRRADRARRGVLQGEPALARPGGGADVLADRRARPRRRRAEPRRPAPAAGPRPAARREGVVPRAARELRRRVRGPRRGGRRHLPGERPDRRAEPRSGGARPARLARRGGAAAAPSRSRSTAPTTTSSTAPSSSRRSRAARTPRTRR